MTQGVGPGMDQNLNWGFPYNDRQKETIFLQVDTRLLFQLRGKNKCKHWGLWSLIGQLCDWFRNKSQKTVKCRDTEWGSAAANQHEKWWSPDLPLPHNIFLHL